jgi:DNA polymerase
MDESLRLYYLDKMGVQCWYALPSAAGHTDSVPLVDATVTTSSRQTDQPETSVKPVNTAIEIVHDPAARLADMQQQVANCKACGLHRTRLHGIAGQGNINAAVLVLLLHPAAADDASGRLGSGEEGELLKKMLLAIGISIDDVYLSSLLKCHIPTGHTINTAEVEACRLHLNRQIEIVKPDYLLVMGETTARCLLNRDLTIDQLREITNLEATPRPDDTDFGSARLMVTYSPGELLDNPVNKRKAWTDLQMLQKWLNLKTA